ncbi:MAG TPA: uracil phosphoribosyltransferase [Abditibacterium sp.]|jgi:uracil phosphoribosyltransferase
MPFPTVVVPNHPLIAENIAICRDKDTSTVAFRAAVANLGRWLGYEACRDWLPILETSVETPLGVFAPATRVDSSQRVEIVPILRAGLALVEGILPLIPDAKILHVGYRRDEETARAVCYLTGFPDRLPSGGRFLILEPMLATGGTLVQVLDAMTQSGADLSLVRVISLISSLSALETIGAKHPAVSIFCAAVDAELNEKSFIVPGLGDAGDRAFGTD